MQSGIRSSTAVPGQWRCTASTHAANPAAPPSGRSSRATAVITACASPMRATASATCSGSMGSGASGRRVSTRQKPQARVQRSPLIMNVAVPSPQHSKMFGQPASSHTVTRSSDRIVRFSSRYSGPMRALTRSHSGLRALISTFVRSSAPGALQRTKVGEGGRQGSRCPAPWRRSRR